MDVQRLNKTVDSEYKSAQKYYQILSVLNDLQLTESEAQLIAFAAIRGNMTDNEIRQDFCQRYDTTVATINNMVYRLKKKNIFHKKGKVLYVNPILTKLDFTKSVSLVISITKIEESLSKV